MGSDSDQPIILEAFSDSGIVTFTVLNPMDGSAIAKNTFEVNKGDASYWMQISGWDGARIYLEMDAGLWLFDTQTRSKVAD